MPNSNLTDTIKRAVEGQKSLLLTVRHGADLEFEVPFDPYIYGDDAMHYQFLWGYLSFNHLLYQFRLDDILEARITWETFKPVSWACFYNALEQELYSIAPDIQAAEVIYNGTHIGEPL